jgi:E3 ubiquitin-protein ligase UBR2
MLFDRRLWKAARTAFHKLLMATILMDMEHKYLFGRLLVQNYPIIFDDFIEDDHEHSVSITSMTVQIFTVPTIASNFLKQVLTNKLFTFFDNLKILSNDINLKVQYFS